MLSSVMSVGTLEDFFGQETQIAPSGLTGHNEKMVLR
jgi:hypothetical protein